MDDYISRERLLYEIRGQHPDDDLHYPIWYEALVKRQPAADVRPVVLCRQCEFCRAVDKYEFWCLGHGSPYRLIRPEDFCSEGRKKE